MTGDWPVGVEWSTPQGVLLLLRLPLFYFKGKGPPERQVLSWMNVVNQSIFSLHIGGREPAQLTRFPEEKRGRSSNIELLDTIPSLFSKVYRNGRHWEWVNYPGRKGQPLYRRERKGLSAHNDCRVSRGWRSNSSHIKSSPSYSE